MVLVPNLEGIVSVLGRGKPWLGCSSRSIRNFLDGHSFLLRVLSAILIVDRWSRQGRTHGLLWHAVSRSDLHHLDLRVERPESSSITIILSWRSFVVASDIDLVAGAGSLGCIGALPVGGAGCRVSVACLQLAGAVVDSSAPIFRIVIVCDGSSVHFLDKSVALVSIDEACKEELVVIVKGDYQGVVKDHCISRLSHMLYLVERQLELG